MMFDSQPLRISIHEYGARTHQRGFGESGERTRPAFLGGPAQHYIVQHGPVRILVRDRRAITPEGARILQRSIRPRKPSTN